MSEFEIHPNLKQLSDSSDKTLHSCPRKYELDKLGDRREDGDTHTNFGKLVGYGIQQYFIHGEINKTLIDMMMFWKADLDEIDEKGRDDKKGFFYAINAINKFVLERKTIFGNYELAVLNGRPAVELGFSIDLGDGFAYRGFVDAVLINKKTRELAVLECKTTKYKKIHEAMFKHSGQALGYSVILEAVSTALGMDGSAFKVYYPVFKTGAFEWETLPFTKTNTHRALWIQNILMDKMDIQRFATQEFFPMRGESCYSFFRPCEHFGMCEMSNKVLLMKGIKERIESDDKYDFKMHIIDLINAQLGKE